jgi:hypothetical protein
VNKIFAIVAILAMLSLVNAGSIYDLNIVIYKNDTVELKNFSIREGSPGPFPDAGADNNYEFKIISRDGSMLFNQSFHLGFVAYRFRGPNSTEPDVIPYNRTEDHWRLPYFEDAALIQLYHEGKLIFEYGIMGSQKEEIVPSNGSSYVALDLTQNVTSNATPGAAPDTTPDAEQDGGMDIYLIFSYAFALFVVAFVIYRILGKPKSGGAA